MILLMTFLIYFAVSYNRQKICYLANTFFATAWNMQQILLLVNQTTYWFHVKGKEKYLPKISNKNLYLAFTLYIYSVVALNR